MQALESCAPVTLKVMRVKLGLILPFLQGTVHGKKMALINLALALEADVRAGRREPYDVINFEWDLYAERILLEDIRTAAWVERRQKENPELPEKYAAIIDKICAGIDRIIQNQRK